MIRSFFKGTRGRSLVVPGDQKDVRGGRKEWKKMNTDPDELVDPRIVHSRRVIREAALAELAEAGYGGFAIESVAARAGVAKSTIYRHWDGRLPLIRDAFEVLNQQPMPEPGGGDPRQRVEQLLRHLVGALADSIFAACLPALIEAAHREADVRAFLDGYSAARRRTLTDAIADGVESGHFPPAADPEQASLALAGAIFYRRLLTPEPLDPDGVPELIEAVLGPRPVEK